MQRRTFLSSNAGVYEATDADCLSLRVLPLGLNLGHDLVEPRAMARKLGQYLRLQAVTLRAEGKEWGERGDWLGNSASPRGAGDC